MSLKPEFLTKGSHTVRIAQFKTFFTLQDGDEATLIANLNGKENMRGIDRMVLLEGGFTPKYTLFC